MHLMGWMPSSISMLEAMSVDYSKTEKLGLKKRGQNTHDCGTTTRGITHACLVGITEGKEREKNRRSF